MASKRSQQSVPATETGAIPGDAKGSRSMMKMPYKGGRNATTEQSRRGAGQVAPRPQASKQGLLASSSATAPTGASMARVKGVGTGDSGLRLPVQSPKTNLQGSAQSYGGNGQPPAARGGPSGLRAGGRNQGWPNGAMYTDSAKKGSSGKDSGPIATRKPARRGKGAAFYGEY